jgi:hypothetical protein
VQPDDEFWRVAGGITDPAQLASVRGKYLTGTPVTITPPPAGEILVGGR